MNVPPDIATKKAIKQMRHAAGNMSCAFELPFEIRSRAAHMLNALANVLEFGTPGGRTPHLPQLESAVEDFIGAWNGERIQLADAERKTTIQRIEEADVYGNAHHDADLMELIGEFVTGEAPMDEKKRALVKLDQVMGTESEEITDQDVLDFIEYAIGEET